MKKAYTFFFFFSFLFFIFLLSFVALRIKATHNANETLINTRFAEMKNTLVSIYLAAGGFESDFFKKRAREVFMSDDKLLLLTIYSNQREISYLIAKNPSYLKNPSAEGLSAGPSAGADWEGSLTYNTIPLSEKIYTGIFYTQDELKFNIDGVFLILGKKDIYPIIKDSIYVFIVGLFVLTLDGIGRNAIVYQGRSDIILSAEGIGGTQDNIGSPFLQG